MLHFSFAGFNSDNRELQNCITATCIKLFKPSEPLVIYFSASNFPYNEGDYNENTKDDGSITISAPTTFNKCKIKAAEFTFGPVTQVILLQSFIKLQQNSKISH